MENQQLKQRVQQDERLKAQHDGLLERLRGARAELDQALAQRQQADLAMGSPAAARPRHGRQAGSQPRDRAQDGFKVSNLLCCA